MVDQSSNETIIKGDTLIAEVVMIATNDLFDIVIHSKMILGDGTFKICPKLWTQVFIISAEVEEDCYIPCIYTFLPDKSKISYDTMFSMLKETLSRRGISLAAEFFMSDFELNIRDMTNII